MNKERWHGDWYICNHGFAIISPYLVIKFLEPFLSNYREKDNITMFVQRMRNEECYGQIVITILQNKKTIDPKDLERFIKLRSDSEFMKCFMNTDFKIMIKIKKGQFRRNLEKIIMIMFEQINNMKIEDVIKNESLLSDQKPI